MTKNVDDTRKTVAYTRVSSQEQAESGVSLAAQAERLRAYALATQRDLSEVIEDAGQSAKSLKRDGMLRLLNDVKAGRIAAILILKLDRLTRSVRDLADLLTIFEKHNVALVSLSESLDSSTAAGRLVLNLLASVSQWEREAVGERTSFALAHKRRNRLAYSKVPFGFRRQADSLLEVPEELWALQVGRRMRGDGISLRRIGEWLTSRGFTARQGGKTWRPSSVAAVLNSRMASEYTN